MKKGSSLFAIFLVATVVICLGELLMAEAVTCSVTELASCAAAIISSEPPSSTCCAKLKEQKPCLCGYFKDPSLGPYIKSPNAKKVAKTCGVPTPKC
ncbi:non-specific lipid-transfer protein 2-like [Lycium ferocissimum]|uniref:non-specific lipid-transfer protein 2-like n=1 Tax=Lycium ferocissimum TaxID=112874 RepID=UPI002815C493|nr:non-specific lipid-transfer protein 2-like [Lycium ferocissimum]